MTVGVGVDLVETERVARALERWGPRLVGKLMDAEEEAALPRPGPDRVLALARAIAAKEAVSKALGTGWSRGVHWRQVLVDQGTEPAVRLTGRAAEAARALGSEGRGRVSWERHGDLVLAEYRLFG